ncbi:hypothetical protein C9374_012141 [Naegleria lovaniensis]|uniref:non-specific serine/threonine protein kinase n=1 Tax=Naegleria lovaniensis TaxID=51637 RepID=A0AA88KI09_NAELO|nr:uncharacterized protein C9374_012141 [Naegleria lovaniensis]KAG2373402.1 hypothetical protein C9374_012141 [Naegleria lovaniensis]
MYSVSSTKQTSVMTRIAVGNMRVVFTQTDLYGGVVTKTIPLVGTFPASISPGSSTLQQCVQYISEKISPSNETTNIHTANNYAILLNMCVSGSFVVSSSPFDYGMINTTLVNIFSTISYMRTNVFHSSVNDLAAEYLTPLVVQVVAFCKKLNIYNTLLQTYGNILATHVKFIVQNIKASRISKNNLQALQQLLLDIYSQKLMIGSSGNNQQLSIITSQILDFVKVMTRSWEIQSISTDGEYSSNALTAKIFTVPNIAEFSGRTFSLFGNSTMTFPKSGLTDAFSTSRYRVLTSVYDFSNIFSNLLPTNSVPFIQSIYTLDVKRSNDDTILDVNNLPQPIQLTFNISSNNLNSTLLQLYSEKKANIVCRYFLESNSVWINDSTITTSVQSLVMTQSVPTFNATLNSTVMINSTTTNYVITCSTNHLTSFAVFADIYPPFINTSTNSTNTTNIDPNNPRVVTPTGLGGGEIAAIVVSILVVCVLAPLAILVFAALGFYLLKRKQKSKATTNSHVAATSEALVMKELEPKSHLQDSSSALFISEYRSMKGGTAMNDFSSQSSVTSSPTTSTIVTQNILGKKYEIIEKIGAGAFGAVFKASNLSYSGKSSESPFVAVKKIQLSGLSELNEKFKEAVAMFKTKHDHLVSLQDALIDEASMSLFLVMKYYAHGDLDQFIKDKKHLPEKVLKQIIVQVCQGLKYLEQERDMLHRDVKPSNIFIESFDTKKNKIQVVLSDFGLARESTMLQSMSFAGTPFFMSPQMLIGSKYSFNADIFSLGCSIFGLATFDLTVSLAQLYFKRCQTLKKSSNM